ncbi:MAG: TIGR02186 family protein, partial [Pseudomonadota bacterium]|nr:TIGR02186 family protein [Pseudomonadota bacterium]
VRPGGGDVVVMPEGRDAPGASAGTDREQVIAALSHNQVSITTTYAGSEIFVFGAIKRSAPARTGKPDVIVTISGPSTPVTVRRKARMFGVWANADATVVDAAPSFYAVASTGPLDRVLSATENLRHRIALDTQVRAIGSASDVADPDAFREAVMRLRRDKGLYVEAPIEVEVIEDTLFTTHVALPANIVEGDYVARVFLVHDRQVIDLHETVVGVRKVGLERWLFALSRQSPLQYGLLALFVALAAGWGAAEAFRLLRR